MLQKQVITIPIANGIDSKTDEKLVDPGKTLVLENASFFKAGRLSKRYGRSSLTDVSSDGVLSSGTITALASDDRQISALSTNGFYSLFKNNTKWIKTSDFTNSFKVSTEFANRTGKDSYYTDCDYDSTSGLIATASIQSDGVTTPFISLVLEDINTGTKRTSKISTGASIGPMRVLVVTDSGNVRIFLFYINANDLSYTVIDDNFSTIVSPTVIKSAPAARHQIALTKDSSNVYFAYKLDTSLDLYKYSFAGSQVLTNNITTATSVSVSGSTIGTGISICENGNNLHLAWYHDVGNESSVQGFNKTTLAQSIPRISIPGALFEVVGICADENRVYISFSSFTTATTTYSTGLFSLDYSSSYSVSSGPSSTVGRLSVLAHPFIQNNKPYAILQCNESHQLTAFIAGFDGMPVSKVSPLQVLSSGTATGATNRNYLIPKTSYAPGDAYTAFDKLFSSTSTVDVGEYVSTRSPAILKIEALEEYRTNTRNKIGESIYFTRGLTLELDGRKPHENGFFLSPLIRTIAPSTTGGSIAAGTYNYCAIYEFFDGNGQLTKSSPCPAQTTPTTGSTSKVTLTIKLPALTFKGSVNGSTSTQDNIRPAVVIYRTTNDGTTFYRIGAIDCFACGGQEDTFTDTLNDTSITNNETLYTTGGVLENDSAPSGGFSFSAGNRLMVGDMEQGDEIAYSKKQLYGSSVEFNDGLRMRIQSGTNADKSRLRAGAYMDGKVILFREKSLSYFVGDGPLDTGANDTFTVPEVISSDTGASNQKSVLNIPTGVMFKSLKGIYLLDRSLQVSYIGAPVEAYNSENIVASVLHDKYNEARFYTDQGNCLVYNYFFDQWSVSPDQTSVDADNWQDKPVQIASNKVFREDEGSFVDGITLYNLRVKTPWLKLSGLQDFGRIWSVTILGDYKSSHTLKVIARYDYDEDYTEEYDVAPQASDSQYQYRVHLKKQKCEAVQFEIYDENITGESMSLNALTMEVGLKKGSMKLPASRKY